MHSLSSARGEVRRDFMQEWRDMRLKWDLGGWLDVAELLKEKGWEYHPYLDWKRD